MGRLSISDLIDAGRKALTDGHQLCALSMALSLPSVCSRLEFKDDPEYFDTQKKGKSWRDKKAYVAWCKKYLFKGSHEQKFFGENGPDILYSLRCGMVHEGRTDIQHERRYIYLSTDEYDSTSQFGDKSIISIPFLCNIIFYGVDSWRMISDTDGYLSAFVFDKYNDEDMLLYNELCKESRLCSSVSANE